MTGGNAFNNHDHDQGVKRHRAPKPRPLADEKARAGTVRRKIEDLHLARELGVDVSELADVGD